MKICPLCDVAYPEPHTRCPQDGALLLESRELAPGHIVRGKYRIVKKIGQGGMGTVYLAEDTFLNAQMALKFLSSELSSDPSFTRRFRDEARAAFKLRHPNIVEVNGLDQSDDGSLFIAMEYVDGLSLRALLDDVGGPLSVPRAIGIAQGIAAGLGAAHFNGFVHRDIKPENIIVCQHGATEQPKILDFGIVAVMERAQAEDAPSQRLSRGPILTAEYAAPEQWGFVKPEELDGRTDLYALGGVLYEMLTGRLAFSARSHEEWMDQHLKAVPAPLSHFSPEISRYPGMDELVLWTLKKKREDRPENVKQFLAALDAIPKTPIPIPQGPRQKQRAETIGDDTLLIKVQQPGHERQHPSKDPSAGHPATSRLARYGSMCLLVIALLAFGGYWLKEKKETPRKDDVVLTHGTAGDVVTVPNPPKPIGNPPPKPLPKPLPAPPTPKLTAADIEKQGVTLYTARNYNKAGPLFDQACHGGSAEGCRHLADMYAKGEGFTVDSAKVVALRDQSCEARDMAACYQLGFNYSTAEGVPKNMLKFEELESKACEGKYPEACMKLGALYLSEVGFKDKQKAAHFYDTACEEGSREGCYFTGKIYDIGSGVTRDPDKAKESYTKSCRMGYEKACDELKTKP